MWNKKFSGFKSILLIDKITSMHNIETLVIIYSPHKLEVYFKWFIHCHISFFKYFIKYITTLTNSKFLILNYSNTIYKFSLSSNVSKSLNTFGWSYIYVIKYHLLHDGNFIHQSLFVFDNPFIDYFNCSHLLCYSMSCSVYFTVCSLANFLKIS